MYERIPKFDMPTTIDSAAQFLIDELLLREQIDMSNLHLDELDSIHIQIRHEIIKDFRLLEGNNSLLKLCVKFAIKKNLKNFDPTYAIIYRVWDMLRKSHKMRIIK